jgi:hypothetical protein
MTKIISPDFITTWQNVIGHNIIIISLGVIIHH